MVGLDELRARWPADLRAAGAPGARDALGGEAAVADAFDELVTRHAEAVRRYHTLDHVAAVLRHVDELLAEDTELDERTRGAIALAAWWHDAVYDPTRGDNEARSADRAAAVLGALGIRPAGVTEVARLIALTAHHDVRPEDRAGAVLVDADLAILGAPWPVYERYARGVREEYGHVPDDLFRTSRTLVLDGLAAHPRLYFTDAFHDRYEAAARANLRREQAELAAGEP